MATELTLHQRRRDPTPQELAGIPWLALLQPPEREVAVRNIKVGDAMPGDYVCRVGRPVTYWFGVVEGLLKMSNENAQGQTITFSGLPPGGWFGEGTVLKREIYRYNIQALRRSVVAGLPADTFHWLLDHSIGFNRFVMNQLNERLAQFIAARDPVVGLAARAQPEFGHALVQADRLAHAATPCRPLVRKASRSRMRKPP